MVLNTHLDSSRSAAFLRDAERIGRMGSWMVDLVSKSSIWSDGNFAIYDEQPGSVKPSLAYVMRRINPACRPHVKKAIDEVINTRLPTELTIKVLDKEDKGYKYVLIRMRPWYENGEMIAIKGTNMDITDVYRAKKQLERQNRALEEHNERLSEFAFLNSHELRAPLANLIGLIDLMKQDECLTHLETAERLVGQIDEIVKRINQTVTPAPPKLDAEDKSHRQSA